MRTLALCSLSTLLLLGCSGEDDGKGRTGAGVGAGATGGAAGSGALNVGGQSGRSGAAGAAGGGGLAGTAGASGASGAAGQAGASGAAGSAGAGGLRASTAVCGNGILELGERCDGDQGTTEDVSCAELLGDPAATGKPSCDRCFPSYVGCVSCQNGKKDGDETDVDCGSQAKCGPCQLGATCAVAADCDAALACVGGVCTELAVTYGAQLPSVPTGTRVIVPVIVEATPPLAPGVSAQGIDSSGAVVFDATADAFHLRAQIAPGGVPSSSLSIGGHTIGLPGLVSPGEQAGGAVPAIQAIEGRLGVCASTLPSAPPLVLEAVASGSAPALELPIGRPFCLRITLAQKTQGIASFVLAGGVVGTTSPQEPSAVFEVDFTLPSTPLYVGPSGNTPVQLLMTENSGGATLATQPLVLSPFTSRAGATGVGTTSSPAAPPTDFAAFGAPFTKPTVWQIAGPHPVPATGLVLPDNLTVRGLDANAGFVGSASGAPVTLGKASRLRDLVVDGGANPASTCLQVVGQETWLSRVRLRRCKTGVVLKDGAAARFLGTGTDDLTDVETGFDGGKGATLVVQNTSLVGNASSQDAVRGFSEGTVSLRRVSTQSFRRGLAMAATSRTRLDSSTLSFSVNGVLLPAGAELVTNDSTLVGPATTSALGLSVGAQASLVARGLRVADASTGALTVAAGEAKLTATVFDHCGGTETSAAVLDQGGSLEAHGLLVASPGQLGIFAAKEAGSLRLTGTVIERTTFRGIWVYGGTADLQTVKIIDPDRDGLAYGDPCGKVTTRDLDIVKKQPNDGIATLVFADRNDTPTDDISLRTLVAGAGAVLTSVPGAPVCGKFFSDPVGGRYISVNGQSVEMCF